MREQKQQRAESAERTGGRETLETAAEMPLIVSARTGLAGRDDAIVRRFPADYAGTVREVLDYVTTKDITSEERDLAQSVKREVDGKQSVVMINGKKAALEDKASKYATVKSHNLPGGVKRNYMELEIEVSSVQQGGRKAYSFYR